MAIRTPGIAGVDIRKQAGRLLAKETRQPLGTTPTGEPTFRMQGLPGFTEAKTALGSEIDRRLDDLRRRLLAAGYAPGTVDAVIARTRAQSVEFSTLLGQEALTKEKITAARRAERRGFLGGLVGLVLGRAIPAPRSTSLDALEQAIQSLGLGPEETPAG